MNGIQGQTAECSEKLRLAKSIALAFLLYSLWSVFRDMTKAAYSLLGRDLSSLLTFNLMLYFGH